MLKREKKSIAATTTYGYDAIDHLNSDARNGYSGSYTYDAVGLKTIVAVSNDTMTLSYDFDGWLTQITYE